MGINMSEQKDLIKGHTYNKGKNNNLFVLIHVSYMAHNINMCLFWLFVGTCVALK